MQIKSEEISIPVANHSMRILVTAPTTAGKYPGIIYFSDIFQISDAMRRACARLAGYGFVVAAHEIFHRLESAGTVLAQDDAGRARGMSNQSSTPITHFDEDAGAVIDYLKQHPLVDPDRLGAGGFCIGGHLAYRAALHPDINATVCFYPTWLHNGELGAGQQADSLERAGDINGQMLLIFGAYDPLIPAAGREHIETVLQQASVSYETRLYQADHGFMRDDRAAFDPEAADHALNEAVNFYRSVLRS